MFEPTRDQYGRPIWTPNDPPVRTANGVVIQHGMPVFTNNLDLGTVDLGVDGGREATYEWHGVEKRWVLWFDVVTVRNYKGEPTNDRIMQSHDRVATSFDGRSACVEIATVETVATDDPDALTADAQQAKQEARVLRAARRKEARQVEVMPLAEALAALRRTR